MSRTRVLIGVMGVDQHENGAIVVSRFLREAQMDVRYVGPFQTPDSLLEQAIREDVDVIGISCHSWEFLHYLPELISTLEGAPRRIPVVVGGSVLTPQDREKLRELGVAASFGAGAEPDDIVDAIRQLAHPRLAERLHAK